MTNEEFWSALDGISRRPHPEGFHHVDPLGKAMVPLLRQAEEENLSLLIAAVPTGPQQGDSTSVSFLYTGDERNMWYCCFTSLEMGQKLLKDGLRSPSGQPSAQIFLVPIRSVMKYFDRPEVQGLFFNFMDNTWVSVPKSIVHRRWRETKSAPRGISRTDRKRASWTPRPARTAVRKKSAPPDPPSS